MNPRNVFAAAGWWSGTGLVPVDILHLNGGTKTVFFINIFGKYQAITSKLFIEHREIKVPNAAFERALGSITGPMVLLALTWTLFFFSSRNRSILNTSSKT